MDPIFLLFIPLVQVVIGVIVFRKNPRNAQNWSFALLMIGLAGWGATIFLRPYTPDFLQLLSGRSTFAFASLIPCSFFIFSLAVSKDKNLNTLLYPSLILGIFFALFSFTPAVIPSVTQLTWGYNPIQGWGLSILDGYIFVFMTLGICHLIQNFRESSGIDRYKMGYILLGASLSTIIGVTTNIVWPSITLSTELSEVGPLASIFFTLFSAYAILKYRFFDIRVVIRKGLVYGILLSVLFGFASFFVILLADAITNSFALNVYISAAMIAAVLAVSFYPLRRGARGIVDVFLARRVPTDMRSTVTNTTIQDVIEQAQTILENVVEVQPIKMILAQDEHTLGWPGRALTHLREYLASTKKALLLQEIPYARADCPHDVGKALDILEREMFERNIAMIVPMLTIESGLMGYIVLPPKSDGTIFTADKIYYLERFANAIAFRIEGEIREASQISPKKI